MPPRKVASKVKQNDGVISRPKGFSNATPGNIRDDQENNVTQILSQRLNNMEQQLVLLRGDLKDAIDTLKRKDQEITTLENKIALVERRKEAEDNSNSTNEILNDLSEDVDPESKAKQEVLQKECNVLAQKLQEMEKFFGDYGLVWVKEDALDEKDPNNLWVRKTDVHYTPDFDKIFLVVEELNVGNAEPQIVKTGNTAQFKSADVVNLTLYADGIQVENNPFRLYESPSVEEFFRDLEDGYFPTELKGKYPEGVIFKVKDMRNSKFADDLHKRPVIKRGPLTSPSPPKVSTSSVPRESPNLSSEKGEDPESEKICKLRSSKSPRRSKTLSRRGSASSKRSIIKNTGAKVDEKILPGDSAKPNTVSGNVDLGGDMKQETSEAAGDPKASPGGVGVPATPISPVEVGVNDAEIKQEKDLTETKTVPEDGTEGTKTDEGAKGIKNVDVADNVPSSPGATAGTGDNTGAKFDPQITTESSMKQLFVGNSPGGSIMRVAKPSSANPQGVDLVKELTKDSFGLPRPPLSRSVSGRFKDLPELSRPPSKHFDNYFLNKTEETQTSKTYVMPQTPQSQPTNITNITYNEAPITIQMTPSELKDAEHKTIPTSLNACPMHHPHPCKCAHGPPNSASQEENDIEPLGLIRITGETEYREKYTESAANSRNVLMHKKKSQEDDTRKMSPHSTLAARDVAPIPPDPLEKGAAFDPNVTWPNFQYFGHPKGQEASTPPPPSPPRPVSQPHSPKKKSNSPEVIQLNKKTSDRMISVKMRTSSGHKEFNANLYPEEPVKKLWSLLKLNDQEYSLTTPQAPHVLLRRGSIGEHLREKDLSLVLTKTKIDEPEGKKSGSRSSTNDQATKDKSVVKTNITEGITDKTASPKPQLKTSSKEGVSDTPTLPTKVKTELSTTNKEGSNITNLNINISIDSHTSHNERAQVSNVGAPGLLPSSRKKSTSNRSSSSSKNINKREGSYLVLSPSPSTNPQKKHKDPNIHNPIPITPKSRAESLSEHLSQLSLHRRSYQNISYRESLVKGLVHLEPALLDKDEASTGSNKKDGRTPDSKNLGKTSPHISTSNVGGEINAMKNKSNDVGRVTTSKERTKPVTNNKPNKISSSQSLKHSHNDALGKKSSPDNFGSKSSIKKAKRGSSKSIDLEGNKKRVPLVSQEKSDNLKSVIYPPSLPTLEEEKLTDQIKFGNDSTSERKNAGLDHNKEKIPSPNQSGGAVIGKIPSHQIQASQVDSNSPTVDVASSNRERSPERKDNKEKLNSSEKLSGHSSPQENKIDQKNPDITFQRRVSNNKEIPSEKHQHTMALDQETLLNDKTSASEKDRTRNNIEVQLGSPDGREIVSPIVTEIIVHSFHQDGSKGSSGGNESSRKPDDSRNEQNKAEQKTHEREDSGGRKKSMSPPKSFMTANGDVNTKRSSGHPITDGEGIKVPLTQGADSAKLSDTHAIVSTEVGGVSLKENKDLKTPNVKMPNAESDVSPIISTEVGVVSLKENKDAITPNVKTPNVELDIHSVNGAGVRAASPKGNGNVATPNVETPNAESEIRPIISSEVGVVSLKEIEGATTPNLKTPNVELDIHSVNGAGVRAASPKGDGDVAIPKAETPNAESEIRPIISSEEGVVSLKENKNAITPNVNTPNVELDIHPINGAGVRAASPKGDADVTTAKKETPKEESNNLPISTEVGAESPTEKDDFTASKVKTLNAVPPHIEKSDGDFKDEKEAKVSSMNYDKLDSEQEFKREAQNGSPTSTTTNEDELKPNENVQVEENMGKPKNETSKGGIKIKKRKSPQEKNSGGSEKENNLQEYKSDENGEKNEDLASPVMSKEGIAQNEDVASESSLA